MSVTVVAVDFGASSMRVCRVELGDGAPCVDVVHRVTHAPRRDDRGVLRWEWDRLTAELDVGLDRALAIGPVASIGIDTWGVDYGLLDAHGELLEPPISYRDERTNGYRSVVERIGERRLYELTGMQLLPFNTIFQLAAHDPASSLSGARRHAPRARRRAPDRRDPDGPSSGSPSGTGTTSRPCSTTSPPDRTRSVPVLNLVLLMFGIGSACGIERTQFTQL